MLRVSQGLDLAIKEEREGKESYKDQREMHQETGGRETRGRRQDPNSGNTGVVNSLHVTGQSKPERKGTF